MQICEAQRNKQFSTKKVQVHSWARLAPSPLPLRVAYEAHEQARTPRSLARARAHSSSLPCAALLCNRCAGCRMALCIASSQHPQASLALSAPSAHEARSTLATARVAAAQLSYSSPHGLASHTSTTHRVRAYGSCLRTNLIKIKFNFTNLH